MVDSTKKGPFLWVALDGLREDEQRTLSIARELDQIPGHFGFKVNLDALLWCGLREFTWSNGDRHIFLDTKMWNGARTMMQVFLDCHRANITAVNAYALADDELKRAIEGFHSQTNVDSQLRIYAVAVLTHYSVEWACKHFGLTFEEAVSMLVRTGLEAGADGIILPGTKLSLVEDMDILKVCPGARPPGYVDKRHKEHYDPSIMAGRTDVEVVCGSPIMKAPDPSAALEAMLNTLGG